MAKKKNRRTKSKQQSAPLFEDLSPHAKQGIAAISFTVLALFFIFSSLGFAGIAGDITQKVLESLFGVVGFVLAPILCFLFVYIFLKPKDDDHISPSKLIGAILLFLAILGLFDLTLEGGGFVGLGVSYPLNSLFGAWITGILLFALTVIGIFLTFNTSFKDIFSKRIVEEDEDELEVPDPMLSNPVDEEEDAEEESEEDKEKPKKKTGGGKIIDKIRESDFQVSSFRGTYAPPPLSLLSKNKGKPDVGDVKANSVTIKRTLKKFGIDVEMDAVTIGSSVTRYAIKPAEGVKLEKIVGLQTNLAYALAADSIRIEAPIPGKSLVGIEVPNKQRQTVGIASLFASPEFVDSPKPLYTVLGKNITGEAEFADVARMPHGLIAGTTGSGKSVVIHNIIVSLLFRNSPDQLRLIMVDPKLVELTLYNGIPHLLTPVITDAKVVLRALKWSIKEMDRRLEILREHKVQNISSYHEKIYNPAKKKFEEKGSPEEVRGELPEPLPYIVIIIDELADLMSTYPKELEGSIVRLAQKSRAAGIHLILATQRPEVKVITGLIKANLPTRIALKVNSIIDSRTILDQPGAEKLLGKGDMLFLSNESPKPSRLQSAFVSEDEVGKVVKYLKNQEDLQELDTIDLNPQNDKADGAVFSSSFDDDDEDELYEDARMAVLEAGKASTSYLQRKLRVGYSRAARLIDILEERGVIGPADGSKPRQILEGMNEEVDDEEEMVEDED